MTLQASRRVFPLLFLPYLLAITACEPSRSDIGSIAVVAGYGLVRCECDLIVIDRDPNIIWSEVKYSRAYCSVDELVTGFLAAARESAVATGRLREGRADISFSGPGKYWVLTDGLIKLEGERLLWSLPLPKVDDCTNFRQITLHRTNAALVLEQDDHPLQ